MQKQIFGYLVWFMRCIYWCARIYVWAHHMYTVEWT